MTDPETEIINIRRHHIEDMRALVGQFETERTDWDAKLQQATARECGALCGDGEQDRDELPKSASCARRAGGGRRATIRRSVSCRHQREQRLPEWRTPGARSSWQPAGDHARYRLDTPGEVNRDNLVGSLAELIKERNELRDSAVELAELVKGRDALRHSESLDAVKAGSDAQILQDTVDSQKRTIDTHIKNIEVLNRVAADNLQAIDHQRGEIQTVTERYRAAEGLVNRWEAVAHEREANLKNAHEILLQQGIDLDVFRERAERAEEELREEQARYAGLQSASQAVGEQLRREWARRDTLAEFTVRPVTNGQFQWVYVEHAAGGPFCDLTYPQTLPGDVALLSQIVHDAYLHATQHHGPQTPEGVDEVSPDDAEDPCDAICHPEHGACCGKVKEPPTEVNE
jgi:hypothetical protein